MCPVWFRCCLAAVIATLCSATASDSHACNSNFGELSSSGTASTAEGAANPRCVPASGARQIKGLEGTRGEACTELDQVSLMQVGYHLNPPDEPDDSAAGHLPSVPMVDTTSVQSSLISRSATAAIAADGMVKQWTVPLHLTSLRVFITRENASASRSVGSIMWTLVGVASFVCLCMIGASCFVGFAGSDDDPPTAGWVRRNRTPKGSLPQTPGMQQQQKQPWQPLLQQRQQQKQRPQQPDERAPPTASLLLQSAQKLNECQAALRQSQDALQHAGSPTHSSTPHTGASASRSDGVFARMLPREWSSSGGETAGPAPDLSSPPILCHSLVLSNAEARFMIPMDSLSHVDVGAAIDITGTSGRKLLQACVLDRGGGNRELHVSSIGCEDDPRAVVVTEAQSSTLKIFARGGHLFGTLDLSEVQSSGCALLTCGGARAMKIETGSMQNLEMTAHAMDGRDLANAGRASPPVQSTITASSCVGGDSWKLQVKPHSDAVLIVACMLSMILLQQSGYAPPTTGSLDVDTAPSLRAIGKHDL